MNHHRSIAIIGAGPAGLTCAETLADLGYKNVTLFEASKVAGGKSRSIAYTGAPPQGRGVFEAGTVFFLRSRLYTKFLQRCGLSEACVPLPPIKIADVPSGRVAAPFQAFPRPWIGAVVSELLRFQGELSRLEKAHLSQPGIAPHITPELCEPASVWFQAKRLPYLQRLLLPFAAASQLGAEAEQTPAIYFVRLLLLLRRYSFFQQLRSQMLQLRVGNGTVWQKMAERHTARLGEPVLKLRRDKSVEITTEKGTYHFDAVIVTTAPSRFLAVADASPDEQRVFRQVKSCERMILTARVTGLKAGICYAPTYGSGPVPPAHPALLYEVDSGSGVFNFYPYLDHGTTPADAEKALAATVEQMGGRVVETISKIHVRDWFPHFPSAALAAGAYRDFTALQGKRNTWFAGELAAGVAVPYVMEHAEALCQSAFGEI